MKKKEKINNKNMDNRPFSHKKIELSKFKIGNHDNKYIINDNIKKKKDDKNKIKT